MSQNATSLPNTAGATFRSNANNAFDTVVTLNSGTAAPGTTSAGMLWYDTTNAVVKQRNATNTAWITRWTVANAEGTLSTHLLFTADNTWDIGASGATRPRDLFLGRNAVLGGTLGVGSDATIGTGSGGRQLIINGATGAGAGAQIAIQRNSVTKAIIGSDALITGSNSDDLTFYSGANNFNFYAAGVISMKVGPGLQMGSPTGGDKGAGTANFAADIYKNNSAYTNPDYVLEHWATGKVEKFADKAGARGYAGLMPLADVEAYVRERWHLPRFGQDAEHGLFSGADALLASVEEAYLYLFNHEKRFAALEA